MKAAKFLPVVLCVSAVATLGRADTVISVGEHFLLPNTAHQAIQIFGVSSGDQTQGMDFNFEILDGTTIVAGNSAQANARYGYNPTGSAGIGPESVGPKIEAIDVITGTVFASDNTGQQTVFPNDGHLMGVSVTTASGTVPTNGLLATVFIDTTGFAFGALTLSINTPDFIPTDFAGSPGVGNITLNDGRTTPEPSALVIGTVALAGFGAVALRKQKRRVASARRAGAV